jgi:hypothetical protein
MPGQVLCPPGQVEDYDPETGQWMGTCVDETYAYQQGPTYTPPQQSGAVIDPGSGRVIYPTVAKLGVYDQLKKDLGVSGTTLGMTAAIIGLVLFFSVFKK